jgi:mannose/fructose-specific phosphotransferase system component IIA
MKEYAMREMYIATHGRYAEGIVSALNLLIGDDHGVTPVCAYCGEIGQRLNWPSALTLSPGGRSRQ